MVTIVTVERLLDVDVDLADSVCLGGEVGAVKVESSNRDVRLYIYNDKSAAAVGLTQAQALVLAQGLLGACESIEEKT